MKIRQLKRNRQFAQRATVIEVIKQAAAEFVSVFRKKDDELMFADVDLAFATEMVEKAKRQKRAALYIA